MSRSLNGNLRGRAAQTEAREFRESLVGDSSNWQEQAQKIADILGDEYQNWLSTTPDDNEGLNQACADKLEELENGSILEWLAPQQLTSNLEILIAAGCVDANGNLKPYKASGYRSPPMTLEELRYP